MVRSALLDLTFQPLSVAVPFRCVFGSHSSLLERVRASFGHNLVVDQKLVIWPLLFAGFHDPQSAQPVFRTSLHRLLDGL